MTNPIERRELFLAGGSLAAVGLGAGSAAETPAGNPPTPKLPPYAIKPLPLDPQKISGMSERILISHYENNYVGAVKRLNSIADQLATMAYEKTPGFVINGANPGDDVISGGLAFTVQATERTALEMGYTQTIQAYLAACQPSSAP